MQNNTEKENNNISDPKLIINDSNNNENENNDNEGIPILSQLEPILTTSVEDYYKKNYPEYKIIKICNHIFVKIGELYTFNFDKNNNYLPRLSIGPHWYLTIILLILIIGLTIFLYFSIFKNTSLFKILFFFIFIFIEYYFVLKAALTHINVVMNKNRTADNYGYCTICNVYFNPRNKVEHCNYCGVCIEKIDHHCIWMGKCVSKNNLFYFYAMIANIIIIYIYIIYCGIYMAMSKK